MSEISEAAEAAEAYADAMEEMRNFLDNDENGNNFDERMKNLKNGLKKGNWPGEDPFQTNEKFTKYFGKDGSFSSWIDDLEIEKDGELLSDPPRFKRVGAAVGSTNPNDYFSADDIRKGVGSTGPREVFARSPWLLDNDLKWNNGQTFTSDELDNLATRGYTDTIGGAPVGENSTIEIAGGWLTPQRIVEGGYESLDYVFTREQLEESALGRSSQPTGKDLVDKYYRNGGRTAKMTGYNLGDSALNGNDSRSVFKALGMIDGDGNINLGSGEEINAESAADSLDEEAEKRYNTGAYQDKTGEFNSSCAEAKAVCCGDAAASRANFSDIGNNLDSKYGDYRDLTQEQRESAQAVRDAVKNYREPEITRTHENLEKENMEKRGGMSTEDYEKFKEGRDAAFKKQGLDTSAKGRLYRNQADLDKLKKGLRGYFSNATSQQASEAFETFEREGWPIGRSVDDFGNITPPPLANDVETLQKLERAFADMRANNNPLFEGENSSDPKVKAAAEKRIQQWRQNNGLGVTADGGSTEGWYRQDDKGNWSCQPEDCEKAAPDNAERQLEKLREQYPELTEKVKRWWSWKKFFGSLFAMGLGEMLIGHAEAMSGCFLVPTASQGQGQYLPSYKINPMTCLQNHKTWGSGYFLGMHIGENDWFGSTFFGVTPTSQGGNVQAAPMCTRGGKCDRMSFPTQNYFFCDDKNSPGGWRSECPPQSCINNAGPGCKYLPGPANKQPLACFPNTNPVGKASGGKTYFYDHSTRACTEDLTNSANEYGKQFQGPTNYGPPDGCNFICSQTPSTEYFQTTSPAPGCGVGAQNCAVGQTCDKRTNTCVSTNKTCLPVGSSAQPAPGSTINDEMASPGYCVVEGSQDKQFCNTGVEGTLVNCEEGDDWGANNVYTNCKIGGVNFATGGNPDTIFNGYCASKEIKGSITGTYDGGFFGPFGIFGEQIQLTDTVQPMCFNNPAYASPGFDTTTHTTSVDPNAAFIPTTRDGNNYLTCVLPQEYVAGGNQICTTDSDCDATSGQQICVGSYGGKVPHKNNLNEKNNMNPGYCVNVSPCPATASPGQCLTDTNGNKYAAECSSPGGLSACKGKIPGPGPGGVVTSMCVMPADLDARNAKPGSKLGTRGVCLSIDSGKRPQAKRHHAGSTDTKPDPCYEDNADACSNFCTSAGPNGIQVPPGYVLSCRNVGILGAATDWLGQAIGPINGVDPLSGLTKILMWIGIALGVGIVILGILSLFIKRLESALFGWM